MMGFMLSDGPLLASVVVMPLERIKNHRSAIAVNGGPILQFVVCP